MPAVVILGLVEQILRVIANHQQLILSADNETRQRFLDRLDKWEAFWEKLSEPLYKLIVKESERGDDAGSGS